MLKLSNSLSPKNINQLLCGCRRGMLELDQILCKFVKNKYKDLTIKEQQIFNLLLKQEDADLFAWLFGEAVPENLELRNLVLIIKKFKI